jgi:starch-binding outer membrane protein, SusD/RagB family
MKKIYVIIILLICIFVGCEEKVLDKELKTSFSEADVWSDIVLAEKFVIDTYNGLCGFGHGMWSYGAEHSWPTSGTDECFYLFNYGNWPMNDGTLAPNNMGVYYDQWIKKYKYISQVNEFLSRIDELEGADENKIVRLKGEMKYIRAESYSKLINWFGGVPIITEPFTLESEFNESRNSYQDCVDFIVKELDEAKEMLPEINKGDNWGRVDKGACLALKSRQLLYAASKLHDPSITGRLAKGPLYDYNKETKWKDAADAAKVLIDMPHYSLQEVSTPEDYQKLFLYPNSEIIFARPYHSQYGNLFNRPDLIHSPNGFGGVSGDCVTQNVVDNYEMNNGKMIDELESDYVDNPNTTAMYENRELRFYANVIYHSCIYRGREVEFQHPGGADSRDGPNRDAYSRTGYNMRKFNNESVDFLSTGVETPYIYFRLAEIYLNYAEAQYYLGNENIAREYVNKIRNRVHLPDINTSGEELVEDIQHERSIEFCFEGWHRFFDARRWMIAAQVFDEDARGIEWQLLDENGNMSPNGTLTRIYIPVQTRHFYDKMYYLPIPSSEIERTDLEQNVGYD